jgi:hypothetical protein
VNTLHKGDDDDDDDNNNNNNKRKCICDHTQPLSAKERNQI